MFHCQTFLQDHMCEAKREVATVAIHNLNLAISTIRTSNKHGIRGVVRIRESLRVTNLLWLGKVGKQSPPERLGILGGIWRNE